MANTLKCRVHQILPVETNETSNGKSFSKQKIIFNATRYDQMTGEEYPNYPGIEFSGRVLDAIEDLGLNKGDAVEVSFGLEGRFYKTRDTGEEKHFTSIRGFKIERLEQLSRNQVEDRKGQITTAPITSAEQSDDLPF